MRGLPGNIAEHRERLRDLEANVRPVIANGVVQQLQVNGPLPVHTHTGTGQGGLLGSSAFSAQSANVILAGPTAGGAATPTFRAMVSADLPASVVETTDANWIDLTDGGATTLHTHAGGGASPLTTKGDLWGFSTLDARVPVGANDALLIADSAQTLGVKWGTSITALSLDTLALQTANKTYTSTLNMVNATTTITLNFVSAAMAGIGLQNTVKYQQAGAALAMYYGFLNNPTILNDANVNPGPLHGFTDDTILKVVDSGGAVTLTLADWDSFRAHTSMQRTGTSTMTVTAHSMFRAQMQDGPTGTTITTLYGFRYENAILSGGAIGTQIGLDVPALSGASTNIGVRTAADIHVNSGAAVRLFSDTSTTAMGSWNSTTGNLAIGGTRAYTGTVQMITSSGTVTWSSGTPLYQFVAATSTIKYATAPSGFGFASFFSHASTYINDAAASVNPGPINVFYDGGVNTFDTATGRTLSIWTSFNSTPTFSVANSGTGTITSVDQFYASGPNAPTGITIATRRGLHVLTATVSGGTPGVITTQVGVDIDALSGAGTNFGIRNAHNSVQTGYARYGGVTAPTNVSTGHVTIDTALFSPLITGSITNASGGTLTLTSTSHATKGTIILGTTSLGVFDETVGSLKLAGYLSLKAAAAAPSNTTAGDATFIRLQVGTDAALGANIDAAFNLGAGHGVGVAGFLNVATTGTPAAPSNTTAGDGTFLRTFIGAANVAFASGVEFQLKGDGLLNGYLGVGSSDSTLPSNTTAGDGTFKRLRVIASTADAAFTSGVTAAEFVGRNRLGGTDSWYDFKQITTQANITAPAAGDVRLSARQFVSPLATFMATAPNGWHSSMVMRGSTIIPLYPQGTGGVTAKVLGATGSPTQNPCGLIVVPVGILVDFIFFNVSSASTGGNCVVRVVIYTEDGQNKIIDGTCTAGSTDTPGNANGVIVSPNVYLPPGAYYVSIGVSTNGSTQPTISDATLGNTMNTATSAYTLSGTIPWTTGAAPTTFDPATNNSSNLTAANSSTPLVRLRGVVIGTNG